MILKNYKRGYNNTFDCSIHGTIYCSWFEWYQALKYLLRSKKWHYDNVPSDVLNNLLKKDIKNNVKISNTKKIYSIRVNASRAIAEKYGLKNYQAGNYQFIVS